jgi:hypothetical protein
VLSDADVIDVRQLAGALDLWQCMWEPDEQERFETAVVRAMTDENPRATRLHALALCHIVATARLCAAALRVARCGIFDAVESRALEIAAQPLRALVDSGRRMRGDLVALERTLARFVADREDRAADAVLDYADVRDLVAVARTTIDARLFGEVERRLARRGKYQRARAVNVLGFAIRPALIEEQAVVTAAAHAVTSAATHAALATRPGTAAPVAARSPALPPPLPPAQIRVAPAPRPTSASDTSDAIALAARAVALAANA